jgi:hypothetical protein
MNRIFALATVSSLIAISPISYAQMVVQADQATLQPQIGRSEIGFQSCGVRAVVVVATSKYMDAYDFSLNVSADALAGALKAGKSRIQRQEAIKGNYIRDAVVPPPIKFWIAQESEGKALNPFRIIPADTKGYIIEVAELADTYRTIMAMIHGERMQFAVRYKNEPVDLVISFAAPMPEKERGPLLACLNDVVEKLLQQHDKSKQ